MNDLIDTFANRLSQALSIRNMKPIELAEATKIDKSKISSYMSGRYKAKTDGLKKIADVLNVSPIWLMGYDVPMEKEIRQDNNVSPTLDIPQKYPVLGKISAGLPILAVENIEGYMYAPSSKIQSEYDYFFLRVQRRQYELKIP